MRQYDELYEKFRKAVLQRDKYKCKWPNCKNTKKLQVHHIKKYADFPELKNDISNGITLCKYHHKSIWGKEQQYEAMFLGILCGSKILQIMKEIIQERINKRDTT